MWKYKCVSREGFEACKDRVEAERSLGIRDNGYHKE